LQAIYFLTVNYYSTNWIAKLWDSICLQNDVGQILVIVNNSVGDREIHTWVEKENQKNKIQLISASENLGFGRGCNLGIDWIYAQNLEALIWLINPDALLPIDSLLQVRQIFQENAQISILGTMIKSEMNEIQFAGGSFNAQTGEILEIAEIPASNPRNLIETEWLSGCSLIVNLSQFKSCPKFSEDYFLYYEDFDFCRRYAQMGHKIWLSTDIFVFHQVSAIASKYPITKVRHEIHSYLITLKKYCEAKVLYQRSLRILLAAIWQFPFSPKKSLGKLQGLSKFWLKTITTGQDVDTLRD
jgi:N-acetylglucosaminyl-diphospho-decaprenol L-rhamnosyltransferase